MNAFFRTSNFAFGFRRTPAGEGRGVRG